MLRSRHFWLPFSISGILFALFFTWELGVFGDVLPKLPRPTPTSTEIVFTICMIALLALNTGMAFFRIQQGTCPAGAKRASAIAGSLGVIALLCPVCLLIPISLFGITITLTILTPFLPLLRSIVLFLLLVSALLLKPHTTIKK